MNIRDKAKFADALWDWCILDGCFGDTRIRPTDIDGFVERRGHFLTLEGKPYGADIPRGQLITLEAVANTGTHSVIVAFGKPGVPKRLRWISKGNDITIDGDVDRLRSWVKHWFSSAHRVPAGDPIPPPPD